MIERVDFDELHTELTRIRSVSLQRWLMRSRMLASRDIAAAVGIPAPRLNGIRDCLEDPTAEEIAALADFFGVTEDQFRRAMGVLPLIRQMRNGALAGDRRESRRSAH